MKRIVRNFVSKSAGFLGLEVSAAERLDLFADPSRLEKSVAFIERFREIVSDPINLMIQRVPEAGYIRDGRYVVLHNGNLAHYTGPYAYYGSFSRILVINRGVHEPLEEYCFQSVLDRLKSKAPVMVELGAYWSHYSMWMKKRFAGATCYMVEPDAEGLESGRRNFRLNGFDGEFIQRMISNTDLRIDDFVAAKSLAHLDVFHCDIQGFEIEMLGGATKFFSTYTADHVFISTHGQKIHDEVVSTLSAHGYRIEISSGYDTHTTSSDGFVLATSPKVAPVFAHFHPLGRTEIANSSPAELLASLNAIA